MVRLQNPAVPGVIVNVRDGETLPGWSPVEEPKPEKTVAKPAARPAASK